MWALLLDAEVPFLGEVKDLECVAAVLLHLVVSVVRSQRRSFLVRDVLAGDLGKGSAAVSFVAGQISEVVSVKPCFQLRCFESRLELELPGWLGMSWQRPFLGQIERFD